MPVVGQVWPGGRRERPHEVHQARDADVVDGGGEDVGGEGDADQRGIATVGAAEDRDTIAVRVALLDRPVHGVDEVVVHLARELTDGGLHERLAEAGRSAEVDLQHRITAVGEQLGFGVEAPAVARPRAAVDEQHQRQPFRLDPDRQREIRMQVEAVARGDRDRCHRCQRLGIQMRIRPEQQPALAGGVVVEVGAGRARGRG